VITGGEGELARAIAAELQAAGAEVHAPGRVELDVTSAENVRSYFGALERLDLLINNAGVSDDAVVAKMSGQQWDCVVGVNLRGAFLCSQAATRTMVAQRSGHIINIGSFSARFGTSGQANYAAAKAGLIGLTQSLAKELGRRNVRVNCVLPGYLETKFVAQVPEEAQERILRMHELGRFNTVADAARFIALLDTMAHVSGQVFQLDSRIAPWT
jgi:3-oxoacyl-[acyl-carrier protein] reductase